MSSVLPSGVKCSSSVQLLATVGDGVGALLGAVARVLGTPKARVSTTRAGQTDDQLVVILGYELAAGHTPQSVTLLCVLVVAQFASDVSI